MPLYAAAAAEELALGVFHWTEDEFWRTSLKAWDRAVAGYRKSNDPDPPRMTRSRYEKLKAKHLNG